MDSDNLLKNVQIVAAIKQAAITTGSGELTKNCDTELQNLLDKV